MAAPVYVDTSFLVSLYVDDANSARAIAKAEGLTPLVLTTLIDHELRNAIRLCVFRRQISATQRDAVLQNLEEDRAAGTLHVVPLNWAKTFIAAESLSRRHTEKIGSRSMDVLHVAAAVALKAERFFTFDDRQRRLAELAGLDVN